VGHLKRRGYLMGFEGIRRISWLGVLGGCFFGLIPASTRDLGETILGFFRVFLRVFSGVI
jgi:hypothetical protein